MQSGATPTRISTREELHALLQEHYFKANVTLPSFLELLLARKTPADFTIYSFINMLDAYQARWEEILAQGKRDLGDEQFKYYLRCMTLPIDFDSWALVRKWTELIETMTKESQQQLHKTYYAKPLLFRVIYTSVSLFTSVIRAITNFLIPYYFRDKSILLPKLSPTVHYLRLPANPLPETTTPPDSPKPTVSVKAAGPAKLGRFAPPTRCPDPEDRTLCLQVSKSHV